jgi:hypothetical protein
MNIKFLGAVLLLTTAATFSQTIEYQNVQKIEPIKQEIQKPIQQAPDDLDAWVNKLAAEFECVGCRPLYRRIDSNGKYSYGCLQFQERTFTDSVKRYGLLPEAEDQEILNQIYDCDFQKQVARQMLLHEVDGCMHWKTSVLRGAGAPPSPAQSCSLI